MKRLIFIHGSNGVGKSSTCELLHKKILNSAWLESEWARKINPFTFNDEIELLTENNITYILRNYFSLSSIETIIFDWGLHGPRERIFNKVLNNLSDIKYEYIPIIVTCSEEENINRMVNDNRDEPRIKRALEIRSLYDDLPHFKVDGTNKTKSEVVEEIIEYISTY